MGLILLTIKLTISAILTNNTHFCQLLLKINIVTKHDILDNFDAKSKFFTISTQNEYFWSFWTKTTTLTILQQNQQFRPYWPKIKISTILSKTDISDHFIQISRFWTILTRNQRFHKKYNKYFLALRQEIMVVFKCQLIFSLFGSLLLT